MRSAFLLAVLGGCYQTQSPALGDGSGSPPGDVADHDPTDADLMCPGSIVHACFTPGTIQTIDQPEIDTDKSSLCQKTDLPICLIAAETVLFGSDGTDTTIQIHGSRPLAIMAHENITVPLDLTLDVSSHRDAGSGRIDGGGFSSNLDCGAPPSITGPTGGPGGSWASPGGVGGPLVAAFAPARGANPTPPTSLIGGCFGAAGGDTDGATSAAPGGALYLFTEGTLQFDGTAMASGAGAIGGSQNPVRGGSGGGSGGTLVLEAVTLLGGGSLYAVGGNGGGGGGSNGAGGPGDDGNIGQGLGGGTGGDFGGLGGMRPSLDGGPNIPGGVGGSGGGAGGDGFILLRGDASGFLPVADPMPQ